jgi:hypothetical protein
MTQLLPVDVSAQPAADYCHTHFGEPSLKNKSSNYTWRGTQVLWSLDFGDVVKIFYPSISAVKNCSI